MTQHAVNTAVLVGAVLVAVGVSFLCWPAGLIVIGVELILGALLLTEIED